MNSRREQEIAEQRRELNEVEHWFRSGRSYEAAMYAASSALSDELPALLYRLWSEGRLGGELQEAVAAVWIHNRSPVRGLGQRRWLQLFKAAGPIVRWVEVSTNGTPVTPEFDHLTEFPTEPLAIWRGAALATGGRGMSWSADRSCGHKFAKDAAEEAPSGLFAATVPPKAILALFADEREQEVVVNPNMLRGRATLVEEVAPDTDWEQDVARFVAKFGRK